MADLIDREALRKAMYHEAFETDSDEQRWDSGCWIRYKMFERILNSMPSAQPEPMWIPMVVKHPSDGQLILVQFINGAHTVIHFSAVGLKDHIAAWMPLPEPYKEDSDG